MAAAAAAMTTALVSSRCALATTFYWNGTYNGSMIYTDDGNWSTYSTGTPGYAQTGSGNTKDPAADRPGSNDIAVFDGSSFPTAYQVNISGTAGYAGGIIFQNPATINGPDATSKPYLVISGSGITDTAAGTVNLGTAGLPITVNLEAAQTWTNNSSFTLTQVGNLNSGVLGVGGGNYTLTTAGTGVICLQGSNTYNGETVVSSGTLQAFNNSALGGGSVNVSGGTLDIGVYSLTESGVTLTSGTIQSTGSTSSTLSSSSFAVQSGTISAVLGGSSGVLTKTAGGTVLMSGANTYGGGTAVNGGILLLGNTLALGSTSGTLSLNGGTLDIATYSPTVGTVTLTNGAIQSTGSTTSTLTASSYVVDAGTISVALAGATASLNKNVASGSVLLTASNSYAGSTQINAGTLVVGNTSALGSNTGTLNLNLGGTLDIGLFSPTVGPVSVFWGNIVSTGSTTSTLTGTSYNVQLGTISVNLAGASAPLSKTNLIGTINTQVILNGSNSYGGGTTVAGGTLTLGNTSALGSTSGSLSVGNGTLTCVLDLTTYSPTVGPVTLAGGVIQSTGSTSSTLTGTSFAFQSGTVSAILAGNLAALTKTTTGAVVLSGANTYGGGTVVSGGSLLVNTPASAGSGTGSGSVVIAGGGLLGIGNISGNISSTSGALLPGPNTTSVGSLSAGGNVTLNNGTTFEVALQSSSNATGVEGVDGDTLVLTGPKTFSANGAMLQILPLNFSGSGPISPQTLYTIVDASSGGGAVDSTIFSNLTPEASPNTYAYSSNGVTADVTFGSSTITVRLDSVPEPGTLGLLGLGFLSLGQRRRRSTSPPIRLRCDTL